MTAFASASSAPAAACGGLLDSADKTGVPFDIVSVSDVYAPRRDEVKTRQNATNAATCMDYNQVLDDKSIDAVIIATPDHWHVRIAVAAIAAGKDVYLEKPVTHTLEEGDTLRKAVRSSKQILQCGMQQRSWTHFRDAVDLIQGGSLGQITQVRTYWWQNYGSNWVPKPIDAAQLDWKQWLGGAPDQPFSSREISSLALVLELRRRRHDRPLHPLDRRRAVGHEIRPAQRRLNARRQMRVQTWDCPDTIQAAFRYPGFDVVYEGMMSSSIDDGGLEFRGTEATLKINRVRHEHLSRGRERRAQSRPQRRSFETAPTRT